MNEIKPKLGLFATTMAVISLVIGIGIFRTPALVAKAAGSPTLFFLAWIVGGLVAIAGALTYAEIGSRRPAAGGFYKIVSQEYNPGFAFMLNWGGILIVSGAGLAAVCIAGSEYLLPMIPFLADKGDTGLKLLASSVIFFLFIINFIGLRTGSGFVSVLTVIKIVMILFFSILALISINAHSTNTAVISEGPGNSWILAVSVSLIAVFYTFGGYHTTMNLGADVKKAKRNFPIAIIVGLGVIFTLYLLINFGYYKVLGLAGIAESDLIAADMAEILLGKFGAQLVSVVIFISVLGFLNATFLHMPRAYYAMAEDRVLPPIFKRVNSKTQAQEFGLAFYSGLGLLFIVFHGKFEEIINYIIFTDSLVLAVAASTIFFLRYREDTPFDGFKIPLYPILPALYILALLAVSASAFVKDPQAGIISTGIILTGYPVYLFLQRFIHR